MRIFLVTGIICLAVAGIFFVSSTIHYLLYLEDLASYEDEQANCPSSPPCFGGRVHFFYEYKWTTIEHVIIGSILVPIGVVLLIKEKKKIIAKN
ncbi:MAG TPA: hypothetical protein VLD38_04340 [Nitrosopumilaceae archaeon]|nr:hypothetical protein [Nitrosopumilaceae archaeon]